MDSPLLDGLGSEAIALVIGTRTAATSSRDSGGTGWASRRTAWTKACRWVADYYTL